MIWTDQQLISQCDIGHGAILQRVVTAQGEHWSVIMIGEKECWSCPTREEADMMRKWCDWGWRAFV